jgi:hypothetical protein
MRWTFKDDAYAQAFSDDEFYALENGFFKPELLLEDQAQVDEVLDAVATIRSFIDACSEADLLELM